MRKLLSALCVVVLFLFVGCGKQVNNINDFSKFSDMKRETDKIEVTFDNYSGEPFYFTISDREDIVEIMDIIFSATFNKMQKEINAGDHTSITIIQGGNEYHLHTFMNKEGEYYYSFSNTHLQTKIAELAREAGAYEQAEKDGSHTCYHVCLEKIEPTCQKEGLLVIGCTDCGDIYEQTILPIVDCYYDESGKCIWCGEELEGGDALLPWMSIITPENILSIEREERAYEVKPGSLTFVFLSETQEDKQAIAEYFQTVQFIKVAKEYAQIEGGGGAHLTVKTTQGEYRYAVANGFVCVDGEYYQPTKDMPIINMQETAHRFVMYESRMQLYKDGELAGEYENILGKLLFVQTEQVDKREEVECILSADGVEIRVYNEKEFSYGEQAYRIVGELDFSEILSRN